MVEPQISPQIKVSSFSNLDYSYYVQSYEFNRKYDNEYKDYLAIDNVICIDFDENTSKFKPLESSSSSTVWEIEKGYGIEAYLASNISYGQLVFVKKNELPILLIIDASLQKAAQRIKNNKKNTKNKNLNAAIDKLLNKFDLSEDELIKFIKNR